MPPRFSFSTDLTSSSVNAPLYRYYSISRAPQLFLTINPKLEKHCTSITTRGVSCCGLAIYIKKYLKAKEKNYGNSNI